jgi:hypothetical protein
MAVSNQSPAYDDASEAYLPEGEAAKFLTLSTPSLRRYRRLGGGPSFIQLSPGRIAYAKSDLMAWARSRRVRNTAEGEAVTHQSRNPEAA